MDDGGRQNPNSEYRNPKQILMSKIQNKNSHRQRKEIQFKRKSS